WASLLTEPDFRMYKAISGDSSNMASGKTIASKTRRSRTRRVTTSCGDERSTTGRSVMVGMAKDGLTCDLRGTAIKTGRRCGTANAIKSARRVPSLGQTVSATEIILGRVAANSINTGAAT